MTQLKKSTTSIAKEVVLNFLNAINEENFEAAKKHAQSDMKFDGVLGQRDSAEAYFKDMEKMKMKYDIKKAFADGDDVCILSDITMGNVTMFTCSWYRLDGGKIKSLKVVFDPRPALEKK
ncbi:nuclear transport factor 2 family protein [Mucilaginibacter sp. 3215]|uniref:nuclear transport factor 2 family protein n=1 Tax=Mucilaginibacter sp. 3215 TaxID=3373912 RepID=UPI003D1B4D42